jgi:hypothetical protein
VGLHGLYGKIYNKTHSLLAVLQMLICMKADADNIMIGTSIFIVLVFLTGTPSLNTIFLKILHTEQFLKPWCIL